MNVVAKVINFNQVKQQVSDKKMEEDYNEYLKLLTHEEVEKEVHFFMANHAHEVTSNTFLAVRGYCLLKELAKRIDCSHMKAKVEEMAENFKEQVN